MYYSIAAHLFIELQVDHKLQHCNPISRNLITDTVTEAAFLVEIFGALGVTRTLISATFLPEGIHILARQHFIQS